MLVVRTRIVALLAAIALMLPSGAVARAHYFCKMMERVMPACCCAGEHDDAVAAPAAKASAPSCCERLQSPTRASASSASLSGPDVPSAALASVLPDFRLEGGPAAVVGLHEPQARAPPSLGPPLFVSYCVFLI
jgi:hypothetical protein